MEKERGEPATYVSRPHFWGSDQLNLFKNGGWEGGREKGIHTQWRKRRERQR